MRYPSLAQIAGWLPLVAVAVTGSGRMTAQETETPDPSAKFVNPNVVIIEKTPAIELSEVIRKVVETLESEGKAKRGEIDRAGKPIELEGILRLRPDVPQDEAVSLVETLRSLGVRRVSFQANGNRRDSTVIIQCPADISWRQVRTMTEELEKLGGFTVDVRVSASNEPVTPAIAITHEPAKRVPRNLVQMTKVLRLLHVPAGDAARIIEQLFVEDAAEHGSGAIRLVADERTNSLIVRSDEATLQVVEALLLRIDGEATSPVHDEQNSDSRGRTGDSRNVGSRRFQQALEGSRGGSDAENKVTLHIDLAREDETAVELRKRYHDLERGVRQLAEKLRGPQPDPATGHRLRTELRDIVETAFAARQELQRAELVEFARRLRSIQQSIQTREKIRRQIIDRRVEELLNPDLDWDKPRRRNQPDFTPGVRGTHATGALGIPAAGSATRGSSTESGRKRNHR